MEKRVLFFLRINVRKSEKENTRNSLKFFLSLLDTNVGKLQRILTRNTKG